MRKVCAESARVAHPLFQAGGSGSSPTSALDLWFVEIDRRTFLPLNRRWHSLLPRVGGGGARVYYAAEHSGVFYAVAQWTNPQSRRLPQLGWIQLKRFAIAPDRPENTASRMLGWMARDIAKRFPDVTTLVSYQDCDKHTGAIYAACGWEPGPIEERSEGTTWKTRERQRKASEPPKRVRRWVKELRR